MLLVIMTRSLIRLDNTVRASLDSNCMTNRYDERQWDWDDDVMTETDSGITESYNEMGKGVGTNTNKEVITNGYEDITKGYERE